MSDVTFLELDEGVGVESEYLHVVKDGVEHEPKPNAKHGDPAPLNSVGIKIPFPIIIDGEVFEEQRTAEITTLPSIDEDWKARPVKEDTNILACARIVPGTRIVETNAPPIVEALLASHWHECDPPKQDTKARQAAGKSDDKAGE